MWWIGGSANFTKKLNEPVRVKTGKIGAVMSGCASKNLLCSLNQMCSAGEVDLASLTNWNHLISWEILIIEGRVEKVVVKFLEQSVSSGDLVQESERHTSHNLCPKGKGNGKVLSDYTVPEVHIGKWWQAQIVALFTDLKLSWAIHPWVLVKKATASQRPLVPCRDGVLSDFDASHHH